ncbi:unnamed protein product [Prunus brigantina]
MNPRKNNNQSQQHHGIYLKINTKRVESSGATRARTVARARSTFLGKREKTHIEVVDVTHRRSHIQNEEKARRGNVEEEVDLVVWGAWQRKGDTKSF